MMSDFLEGLVPIIAILSTIALPVGLGMYLALKSTNQKHVERMEMLKQGLMPPNDEKVIPNRLKTLRNAVLLIGVGVGIAVGILIVKTMHLSEDEGFWAVGPSILFFLGISHLVYFFLSKKHTGNTEDE